MDVVRNAFEQDASANSVCSKIEARTVVSIARSPWHKTGTHVGGEIVILRFLRLSSPSSQFDERLAIAAVIQLDYTHGETRYSGLV